MKKEECEEQLIAYVKVVISAIDDNERHPIHVTGVRNGDVNDDVAFWCDPEDLISADNIEGLGKIEPCSCEEPCVCCCGFDACSNPQAEEEEAPQKATFEEVEAKFEELRELVNRFDERVIICCLFEREGMLHTDILASDSVLKSDGKDSSCLSWSGARGYIKKAKDCFINNPEAIGTGVRYLLES